MRSLFLLLSVALTTLLTDAWAWSFTKAPKVNSTVVSVHQHCDMRCDAREHVAGGALAGVVALDAHLPSGVGFVRVASQRNLPLVNINSLHCDITNH